MSKKESTVVLLLLLALCGLVALAVHKNDQSKPPTKTFITDSYFLSQDDVKEMKRSIKYIEEKTNYVLEKVIEFEQRIDGLEDVDTWGDTFPPRFKY